MSDGRVLVRDASGDLEFDRPVGVASPVNTDRAFASPTGRPDTEQVTSPALENRSVRIVAKAVWLAGAVAAVWLATSGLAATFFIENTDDAMAADRHGRSLVVLAACVVLGLAVVAWFGFAAPLWAVVVLAATALVLLVASAVDLAFVAIPLPYLTMPAAAYGVLARGRSPRPTPDEVSRG
jgi:hypothetical protein